MTQSFSKHLSRSVLGAAAIFAVAAGGLGNAANAASFEALNCVGASSCTFTWTLGKLATKEFRGNCDGKEGPTPVITFSNLYKHTTCTIQYAGVGGKYGIYTTRSCTNWATGKKDEITITLSDC